MKYAVTSTSFIIQAIAFAVGCTASHFTGEPVYAIGTATLCVGFLWGWTMKPKQ